MNTAQIRHRIWVDALPSENKVSFVSDEEHRHAMTVLRLKSGDRVEAIDGSGKAAYARLKIRDDGCVLELDSEHPQGRKADASEVVPLKLAVGLPKADAMEWIIEKATELGVSEIIPVITQFSVIDVKKKGEEFFRVRWQKIADQSMKQCERLTRLKIALPITLTQWAAEAEETAFFACESERSTLPSLRESIQDFKGAGATVLIGPEGGFSPNEIETITRSGIQPISLGPLVMRTETAAVFIASNWVDFFRNSK